MKPNEDPSFGTPSAPPPNELPRPRLKSMSDIRPTPRMQPHVPAQSVLTPPTPVDNPAPEPTSRVDNALAALPAPNVPMGDEKPPKKKRSKLKVIFGVIIGLVVLSLGVIFAAVWWYQQQLQPVSATDTTSKRVVVESGSTPSMIADKLKVAGVIRNTQAFMFYIQLSKQRDNLKAGAYTIKPSQSVPEIVDHLVSGKQDTFSITFLPGDTLANHRKRLVAAGYSEAEVDAAVGVGAAGMGGKMRPKTGGRDEPW